MSAAIAFPIEMETGPLVVAARAVFWVSTALIAYAYVGYPLLIRLLARLRPRPVRKGLVRPRVSVIIAAYNEERVLREKLENTLALAYPRDLLEVVVVADGSSDRTPDIVREFEMRGIRLLFEPERRGKTAALNRAVPQTTGEIVLFSDANTVYGSETVDKIVRNFADQSVGGVSGRKILLAESERLATEGESAYWSYESALKASESQLGSIVGSDGEIFAVRRSLFEEMPRDIVLDDMYLSFRLIEKGYRVVYEPEATSAEYASISLADEFHLKTRNAAAGYQILFRLRTMFLPPKSLFALQFYSHKVLRWLVPFFLVGAFVSSGLIGTPLYRSIFWLQALFYGVALLGWPLHKRMRSGFLYFPLYFSVMNAAALIGFARYFLTGQSPLWRKAER